MEVRSLYHVSLLAEDHITDILGQVYRKTPMLLVAHTLGCPSHADPCLLGNTGSAVQSQRDRGRRDPCFFGYITNGYCHKSYSYTNYIISLITRLLKKVNALTK